MSEEIIIDGVKVEECSYYNKDNTPYCCEVWDNECEAQNCYYKQLKRLEQKYNEVLKLAKQNADSNEYIIQELEKENEELKEKNIELQIILNEIDRPNNYRHVLEEIREIAKTAISASNCSNCDGIGYYTGCLDDKCGDYVIRKIADKINEVLK